MEKLIKVNGLKDVINKTKLFIVWNGSKEDTWNNYIREIYNNTDNSFFLNTQNEYGVDCGWYVKLSDLKPLIEKLRDCVIDECNYETSAYMTNQYNKIVSFINKEINIKYFDESVVCNNKYCIFSIDGICCSNLQHGIDKVEPNRLCCELSVRSDYYDIVKKLRDKAQREIRYMKLDDLLDFDKRYTR